MKAPALVITDATSFSSKGAMIYQGTKEGITYRVKPLTDGRLAMAQRYSTGYGPFTSGKRWEKLARAIIAACESLKVEG